MIRRIRRFVSLSAGDQLLLLRAALMLIATSTALRVLPFSTLKRACGVCTSPAGAYAADNIPRVCYAVNAAAIIVPGNTCLARALVAQRILGSMGIAAVLKIGVAKGGKHVLRAHAWLEYSGRVIIGDSPKLQTYCLL